MKWMILMLGILANASASVLIKVVMSSKETPIQLSHPLTMLCRLPLIVGVGLYGITFVLYALALTHLPLNVAHPILTSGSIACVVLCSVVIFNEHLAFINWVGIGLIILGVIALTAN